MMTGTKAHKVGIYCRLSKDDGTDSESSSIATQRNILTDYVTRQGWRIAQVYVDDGYSGTNFNRPAFKQMVKDIETGLIDCVITKDLSRLGRNYLDCGLYLEVFFPEHNVRYISINDGVDTLNKTAMDITPFRNILNDMYAADVSMKVKSALHSRFNQGKYTATTPPYGYLKDPADKNHLIVDEDVRPVVKEIFALALGGWGVSRIRKHLIGKRILRPAAYALERGDTGFERFFDGDPENRYRWSENSVRQILRSPIYTGHLVGYKRPALSMKSKKRPSRLPEDWEIVKDTHEAIVTQDEFDTVQRLMTSRRHENGTGFINVFAGIVKCADCGYALRANPANRRKRPDPIDCVVYSCNNYTRLGTDECSSHNIEARDLFNAVLADINQLAKDAADDERAVKMLRAKLDTITKGEGAALARERRKSAKRLAELDKLFAALYEDKVADNISERNYSMMTERYEGEQATIQDRLSEIDTVLAEKDRSERSAIDFVALIKGYDGLTELTPAIVNALIERIEVGERYANGDGQLEQRVTIFYKFIGSVSEQVMPVIKRDPAPLAPVRCVCCGAEFAPGSLAARYCPECSPVVRKETKRLYDRNRKDKRSLTHLDEPRACQCCGTEFLPGSHNARFCATCKPVAAKAAAKQWTREYYRKNRKALPSAS
jgi:DNA invertase Pin-like site-specific DNA recombinase